MLQRKRKNAFTPFRDSLSVGLKLCEPGQVSPLFKASQSFPTALRINLLSSTRPLRCCLTQSLLPLQHWPGILFHSLTTLQPYQPSFCQTLKLFPQLRVFVPAVPSTWNSSFSTQGIESFLFQLECHLPKEIFPDPTESETLRMV